MRLQVILCPSNCYVVLLILNFFLYFLARFPHSKPQHMKMWVNNMKRDKWAPTMSSVLCSEHFSTKSFDRKGQTTRLREDAVPTLFEFPQHLRKVHVMLCISFLESRNAD